MPKHLTKNIVIENLENRLEIIKKQINALLIAGTPEENLSIKILKAKQSVLLDLYFTFYHHYEL